MEEFGRMKSPWMVAGRQGESALKWTSSCLPKSSFASFNVLNPRKAAKRWIRKQLKPSTTDVCRLKFMIPKRNLVICFGLDRITFSPLKYVAHAPILKWYIRQRVFREVGKEKKTEKEITDYKSPVFARQVFAEILAGICHEEYYCYSDQEVLYPLSFPCLLTLRHSQFL